MMAKMDDLAVRLAKVDIFNKLPEVERAHLARLAGHHGLRTGEHLCYQGEMWPYLLYVASGEIRWMLLAESGREFVFFSLEPGTIFWGHTIFDEQPMPASLIAAKPSEVYLWTQEVIQPVLQRNPEAMWDMGKTLVRIMRKNRKVVYGLAFQQAIGRLAKLLLSRFDEKGDESVERDLTLSEIANMVASSSEAVCRLLHKLQGNGVLKITRTSITLEDREALEQLVGK